MKKVIMGSVMFALGTLSVLGVWTYHMFDKFLYAAYDYGTQFGGMELSFLKSVVYGTSAGLGFTLAIVLFAGVRERLETSDIPEFLKGMPITLVSASLLSIAFMGFSGLSF